MASNEVPRILNDLISLAEDAADGAQLHGAAISLAQNTEAKIRADLTRLNGDSAAVPPVPGSRAVHATAKATKVQANTNRKTFEKQGRDFITTSVGVLKPLLGNHWNSAWNSAGFTNGSLAVPRDPLPTLYSLRNHFTANPGYEVPSLGIGAAEAAALADLISTYRSAVNAAETALASAKETRDADQATLYHRMTGLRAELDQLLGDDDPIWYAFGFSRPADGDSPGPISTLNLAPGGSGNLIATWSHAIRAERYRVFKKIPGTDPDPVQIVSDVEGETYTLLGLPSAATVEVKEFGQFPESSSLIDITSRDTTNPTVECEKMPLDNALQMQHIP